MDQTYSVAFAALRPALYLVAICFAVVIVAVIIDFISGVTRAKRCRQKTSSKGFRRTVTKLGSYMTLQMSMLVVDVIVIATLIAGRMEGGWTLPVLPWFSTLTALGLTIIEAKSVSENTGSGSLHRDIIDLSRRLLGRLLHL